jgi:hypothetical protein
LARDCVSKGRRGKKGDGREGRNPPQGLSVPVLRVPILQKMIAHLCRNQKEATDPMA